jgi:hypothetical protein
MENETRHCPSYSILNHLQDVIDANDRRYIEMFKAQARTQASCKSHAEDDMRSMRATNEKQHSDLENLFTTLNESVAAHHGADSGSMKTLGWVLAVLSLIIGLSLHFFDMNAPKDSEQSRKNGLILELLKEQTEKIAKDNLDIRNELTRHDSNMYREVAKECKP